MQTSMVFTSLFINKDNLTISKALIAWIKTFCHMLFSNINKSFILKLSSPAGVAFYEGLPWHLVESPTLTWPHCLSVGWTLPKKYMRSSLFLGRRDVWSKDMTWKCKCVSPVLLREQRGDPWVGRLITQCSSSNMSLLPGVCVHIHTGHCSPLFPGINNMDSEGQNYTKEWGRQRCLDFGKNIFLRHFTCAISEKSWVV